MPKTHYLHDGSVLCSHAGEGSDRSDFILDVTCGHCWEKYDDFDDRTANVPEVRYCAGRMRDNLRLATRSYLHEDELHSRKEIITEYGFWFLEGPGSVPDELLPDESSLSDVDGVDASYLKALDGANRSKFIETSQQLLGMYGIWSQRYRENIDQLLRALRPFLTDKEETQRISTDSDLRGAVLEQEGDQCHICGAAFSASDSDSEATIDHVIPEKLGGPSEKWNLRVLCRSCNAFKHVMIDPAGVEKVADHLEKKIRG